MRGWDDGRERFAEDTWSHGVGWEEEGESPRPSNFHARLLKSLVHWRFGGGCGPHTLWE